MSANWASEVVSVSGHLVLKVIVDGFKYLVAFFGAFLISLALTPLFRTLACLFGMVDQPSERRINKTPIPRGGGLSVFLAFHLVLVALVCYLKGPISVQFSYSWQVHFFLASFLLVLIGLVDDKYGIRPVVKLGGQIVVASILYFAGVHIGGILVAFPPWLDYAATVFWIVGAVNAFNLIDGMDGLATGLAVIAAVGLAGSLLFTGHSSATLPYLVLAGACLGFLRYNFHPASVFLGDTGSMFLGLCVATLPLVTGSRKELVASLGVPLLAMGIPIFDTLLAIWRRTVRAMLPQSVVEVGRRVRVMQPDKEHLHHRLLRATANQRVAAWILYGFSAVLVAVGLAGTVLKNRAPGLFLIAFIVAIIVIVRHLARVELWDTGRLLSHERTTIRQSLVVPLSIAVDIAALCAAWFFTRWALGLPLSRTAMLSDLPMRIVPVFIFLVAAKTYWRVWSRAQMRDFALLGVTVLAGTSVGAGLAWIFGDVEEHPIHSLAIRSLFSIFLIVGVRLLRDSLQGVMQVLERKVLLEKPETARIFVYGGGVRFRSYMREMLIRSGHNDRVIVGIIDDDLLLKGRIIAGFPVLGELNELKDLVSQYRVDALVITCVLRPEKQAQVVQLAEELGVLAFVWACEEKPLSTRTAAR